MQYLFYILILLYPSFFIFSQEEQQHIQSVNTENLEVIDSSNEKVEEEKIKKESYLTLGRQYARLKKYDKAKEYFQKAIDAKSSNAEYAIIALTNLQAYLGEKNIAEQLNQLNDTMKAEGYFMLAQGWEEYYLKNSADSTYLELTKEYYAILCVEFSDSIWANKARVKIASLFIKDKEYGHALEYVLAILKFKGADKNLMLDKAWYLLGQILEYSPKHRNPPKAIEAYKNVIQYPNSPYLPTAEERIKYIQKFYLGTK